MILFCFCKSWHKSFSFTREKICVSPAPSLGENKSSKHQLWYLSLSPSLSLSPLRAVWIEKSIQLKINYRMFQTCMWIIFNKWNFPRHLGNNISNCQHLLHPCMVFLYSFVLEHSNIWVAEDMLIQCTETSILIFTGTLKITFYNWHIIAFDIAEGHPRQKMLQRTLQISFLKQRIRTLGI